MQSYWSKISHNYAKSQFFGVYKDIFETLFLNNNHIFLHQINIPFIKAIYKILNINTKMIWSMDYKLNSTDPNQRILDICKILMMQRSINYIFNKTIRG